jgi:hypothetical protein
MHDLNYPRATYQALGHSVTTWSWAIKGPMDGRNNQVHLGQYNTSLKNTQQSNNSSVNVVYYALAIRTT